MKRFLLSLVLICLIVIVSLGILPPGPPSNNYIDSYLNERNLSTASSLYIGASHLAFGLDSLSITKSSPDFHSIGFHGGLGPSFHLDLLNVHPTNDSCIVIFSPTIEWLEKPTITWSLPEILSAQNRNPLSIYRHYGLQTLIETLCHRATRHIRSLSPSTSNNKLQSCDLYHRGIIGQKGVLKDDCRPTNSSKKTCHPRFELNTDYWSETSTSTLWSRIDYILPPPLRECPESGQWSQVFDEFSELTKKPLLLKCEQVVFTDSLFCNPNYHLTKTGSIRYSALITSAIYALQQP